MAAKPSVDGEQWRLSRLIWRWMTDEEPLVVEHKNRDQTDHKWSNLRPATPRQNVWNRGLQKNNTSGYMGVNKYWGGRWQTRIRVDGKLINLGVYDTAEEAAEVYRKKVLELRGGFAPQEYQDRE